MAFDVNTDESMALDMAISPFQCCPKLWKGYAHTHNSTKLFHRRVVRVGIQHVEDSKKFSDP